MMLNKADISDIPFLKALINSAYRGETAKQGWTYESDLLQGVLRTDEAELEALIRNPSVALLTCRNESSQIQGCVCLTQKPEGLYLGMLTVQPELQGAGIGKKLLAAAEDHARALGISRIFMTVFTVREELLAWYERHGYQRNGTIVPFDINLLYGVPTQHLEFYELEKRVGGQAS
jgi:N-acetylglutamate synthase-like GNAT family acetyltransferase